MQAMDHQTAIIIAAYNAESTLARAVASAAAQPETAEICIVDDQSTDATARVAQACAAEDKRVIVLSQNENQGPSAARNAAIAATRAPWIAILDADDYLLPGRLSRMFAAGGDADFIADALIRAPFPADPPPPAPPAPSAQDARLLDFESFVLGNLGKAGHGRDLGFIKPLIQRSFIVRHDIQYQPQMRLGEDYEFYARSLALGARFLLAPATGYVSVDREGSLSNRHTIADLAALRDCDAGLAALRPLTPAEARALRAHADNVDCRLQWRMLIEAVKARDLGASFKAFRSPTVALYLAARLVEQAWQRGTARTRGASAPQATRAASPLG